MNDTSTQPSTPTEENEYSPERRLRIDTQANWWTIVGLIGLLSATLVGSALIGVWLQGDVRSGNLQRPNLFNLGSETMSAEDMTAVFVDTTPELPPAPTLDEAQVPDWTGTDRVTVLVMGIDRRPGQSTRTRTDSMMLLTIDPATNTAGVLSVPRDLYVEIPGFGLDRVNSANVHGGGQLAKQTVEYNLGVRMDYYAIIDFNAFVTFVDEIGGIDVNVPVTINDPKYPDQNFGFDPFYLEAGQYHLDGETALKYARTRATGGADFDRAQRQQDVLLAIRARVVSFQMLPTLITSAPSLLRTMGDSLETDMSINQMIGLARLARDVPRENIKTGVIDGRYITNYSTNTGASVLIPQRDKIGFLMAEIFSLQ